MLRSALMIGLIASSLYSMGCQAAGFDRWAMSHPEFKERYKDPPDGSYLKQEWESTARGMDARFMDDETGFYLGGFAGNDPPFAGAELGLSHYRASWLEYHVGLLASADTGSESVLNYGVNLGTRIQTPTRIAPFIGVGTILGGRSYETNAESDGIDNDGDFFVDETGEVREQSDGLATIYPELGVHFWITPQVRLTGAAAYHVSSNGRDYDTTTYGLWLTGMAW